MTLPFKFLSTSSEVLFSLMTAAREAMNASKSLSLIIHYTELAGKVNPVAPEAPVAPCGPIIVQIIVGRCLNLQ